MWESTPGNDGASGTAAPNAASAPADGMVADGAGSSTAVPGLTGDSGASTLAASGSILIFFAEGVGVGSAAADRAADGVVVPGADAVVDGGPAGPLHSATTSQPVHSRFDLSG